MSSILPDKVIRFQVVLMFFCTKVFLRNKVFTVSATGADHTKDIPVRCTSVFLMFCVSTDITRRCRFILKPLILVRFNEVQSTDNICRKRKPQTKEGAEYRITYMKKRRPPKKGAEHRKYL